MLPRVPLDTFIPKQTPGASGGYLAFGSFTSSEVQSPEYKLVDKDWVKRRGLITWET